MAGGVVCSTVRMLLNDGTSINNDDFLYRWVWQQQCCRRDTADTKVELRIIRCKKNTGTFSLCCYSMIFSYCCWMKFVDKALLPLLFFRMLHYINVRVCSCNLGTSVHAQNCAGAFNIFVSNIRQVSNLRHFVTLRCEDELGHIGFHSLVILGEESSPLIKILIISEGSIGF